MADERAYRIQISYDQESEKFRAQAPELDLEADGETRSDAISALEESIEARMIEAAEGEHLPEPFDVQELSETLEITLAPQLHRDLNYYAKRAKTDVEGLAIQLLSYGIGKLAGKTHFEKAEEREDSGGKERRENRRQGGRNGGRQGGRSRGRRDTPRRDMDDQANFLEYVRELEKGKGGGHRGR